MVLIRGIYVKPAADKRLDSAVRDLVETNLVQGNILRLSASDIAKMARSGGFILPSHVDVTDPMSLHGYCGQLLYAMVPNHGSVKREVLGHSITYEFVPDVPKKGVLI